MTRAALGRYLEDVRTFPSDAALGWRQEGLRGIWREIRSRTLGRVFWSDRLLVIEQDLGLVREAPDPAGVAIEVLAASNLGSLAEIAGSRQVRRFRRAASRGCVCLAARRERRLVGYTWIADRLDPEVSGGAIEMPTDAAYLFDLYVAPEERSRGVGSALVRARMRCARERGFRRGWRMIAPSNRPSLRTLEKTSGGRARVIGELRRLKLFRRVHVRFRPVEADGRMTEEGA